MIDICPICQIATPCDCDDHDETADKFREFVERLASMPTTDENLQSTWCPPEHDDLCDWWRAAVEEARALTGLSYREPALTSTHYSESNDG